MQRRTCRRQERLDNLNLNVYIWNIHLTNTYIYTYTHTQTHKPYPYTYIQVYTYIYKNHTCTIKVMERFQISQENCFTSKTPPNTKTTTRSKPCQKPKCNRPDTYIFYEIITQPLIEEYRFTKPNTRAFKIRQHHCSPAVAEAVVVTSHYSYVKDDK